jgi:hypothetical protein
MLRRSYLLGLKHSDLAANTFTNLEGLNCCWVNKLMLVNMGNFFFYSTIFIFESNRLNRFNSRLDSYMSFYCCNL